ncbi:MAG: lysophospholipid acyltransferase family protein [Chloroflexi bacterium]|nr:lysophospholipid acyltransferase family protein [Chloroflexota bacterium]
MRFQDLFHGERLTEVGLFIGHHMPTWFGHALARVVSWFICLFRPAIYGVVAANLRQILGPGARSKDMRTVACRLFYHAGQTYYDFYHVLDAPRESLPDMMPLDAPLMEMIAAERAQGHGVLLAVAHMSNFDLAALSLGARGLSAQVLSLSRPPGGFTILNRIRAQAGHEMTPISPQALRQAIQRLKQGGIVVTALDRPVPEDEPTVEFFGRRSYLGTGPARLSLATGATLIVVSPYYVPRQGYRLAVLGPIEVARSGDRTHDVAVTMARLAGILEELVRPRPHQWLMFYPVWPPADAPEV